MKERKAETSLERLKDYFINPDLPSSSENLALLSAETVRVMAEIYAKGGVVNDLTPRFKEWLEGASNGKGELEKVLGDILLQESKTRRFDHRFMGQIHPQGNKIGILSNLIAAFMNNNMIVSEVSQSETKMERESIAWMADMFGYDPNKASGNITVGGTTANIAALWVAKNRILEQENLRNPLKRQKRSPELYVVTSKWAHYSIDKACDMLNLGMLKLPSHDFKIDPEGVERAIKNIHKKGKRVAAIVGLAGETETGMVEDLYSLGKIAESFNVYYHVDAAYGGPYMLSRAHEDNGLFKGIEKSDSITIDPHKMLFTPYPAGAIVFKNKKDHDLLHTNTRYLGAVASRVEGSMSSAGVISTWSTINLFGKEGLKVLLDHTLDLAEIAYKEVLNSNLLIPVHKPELNTMLIAINSEFKEKIMSDLNRSQKEEFSTAKERKILLDKLYDNFIEKVKANIDARREGDPYISSNSGVDEDGRSAFRYIGVHPYTTVEIVKDTISLLEEAILDEKRNLTTK